MHFWFLLFSFLKGKREVREKDRNGGNKGENMEKDWYGRTNEERKRLRKEVRKIGREEKGRNLEGRE